MPALTRNHIVAIIKVEIHLWWSMYCAAEDLGLAAD